MSLEYPLPAVLVFIEQYWHDQDCFPAWEDISSLWPHLKESEVFRNAAFSAALRNRGIKIPPRWAREDGAQHFLSAEQIAAIVSICNYADTRSQTAKLRELGLTPAKWSAWLRDPEFANYHERVSQKNFKEGRYVARQGLTRAMDRGDVSAIKYYNELAGEAPEAQNLQYLLTRLIEVMQLHVSDPATLHRIERDFRNVMAGRPLELEGALGAEPPVEKTDSPASKVYPWS